MKIKSIKKISNNSIDGEFSIYTDTDSIFYPLEPLLLAYENEIPKDDAILIDKSLPIISDVQKFINKSYDIYAKKYHNVSEHGWNIKQELISRRAFWSGKKDDKTGEVTGVKKRYAQWIINKEGVEKNYMDVKGLDSVRSDFPKFFRSKMVNILHKILHDETEDDINDLLISIKSEILKCDLVDIMIPTGVNGIDKYETQTINSYKLGTPAHVKAALNYNQLIKHLKLSIYKPLSDGDKIIWCYLKDSNPYKLETLSLPRNESNPEIHQYIEKYIDRMAIFNKLFINKIQSFYDSIGWGTIRLQKNSFFD